MDLSTLESTIKALESSLDSLGVWLTFWTALVVIGLVVEYAEDLKELIIKRPFNWKLFRTMVGGFLITAGVAGELAIQFKEFRVETDLRSATHRVEGLLNKEAGDARKVAGEAISDAGKANERARKIEAQNLATSKTLEVEKGTRLELEKSLAPRELFVIENGKENFGPLKTFAGINVILEYVPDIEAIRAASRIFANIDSAHWHVIDIASNPQAYQTFFDGVLVEYFLPKDDPVTLERSTKDEADFARSTEAADALVGVLKSHHWIARSMFGGKGNPPPDTIKVIVGFKPSPYFDSVRDREFREMLEQQRNNMQQQNPNQ